MKNRDKHKEKYSDNYENWLRHQFGDYFAERFPMTYKELFGS